jgi:hypothetical protein
MVQMQTTQLITCVQIPTSVANEAVFIVPITFQPKVSVISAATMLLGALGTASFSEAKTSPTVAHAIGKFTKTYAYS